MVERRLVEDGNAVAYALTPRGAELRAASRASIEASLHDCRDLEAVVRVDVSIVLGLSPGVLALDDIFEALDNKGDARRY